MFFQRLYRGYFQRKLSQLRFSSLAIALLASTALFATPTPASAQRAAKQAVRVEAPINIAILIQDDLVSSVGNEIRVTADFIRTLPADRSDGS